MLQTLRVSFLSVLVCWTLPLRAAEEKWTRIETPFFSLSAETGNAREAREWAADFEQFRRGMERILNIPPSLLRPAQIIVFRNGRAFDPYKPMKDGKRQEVNGYVRRLPAQTLLITNFDNEDDATRQSIYWGGTQWFLQGYRSKLPDWFSAGFGELFKTFEVRGNNFTIGKARDNIVRSLRDDSLVPVEQLFGVRMNDLAYREDLQTRRFFSESWLFVHYCIFGREGKDKTGRLQQLTEFLAALERGEPEAQAIKTAFGTDFASMTQTLKRYLSGGSYVTYGGKFERETVAAEFKSEPMSAADVEVAKNYACLATNDLVGARGHLGRARMMDEKNKDLFVALGDLAVVEGNNNEAMDSFGRATAFGTTAQRAWYYLAEDYVATASRGTNGLVKFEPTRAREAANRFERAINCYPYFLPSFERLAQLMPSLRVYTEEDRKFLELGLRFKPDSALIKAGLGVWEMKNSRAEAGTARLQAVLAGETDKTLAKEIAQQSLGAISIGADEVEARRLLAAGRAAEAGVLLQRTIANPLSVSRRAELLQLRQEISRVELLDRAEELITAGEGHKGSVLIRGVLEDEIPVEIRQRGEALLRRATVK